jgi:hypothetical protein
MMLLNGSWLRRLITDSTAPARLVGCIVRCAQRNTEPSKRPPYEIKVLLDQYGEPAALGLLTALLTIQLRTWVA